MKKLMMGLTGWVIGILLLVNGSAIASATGSTASESILEDAGSLTLKHLLIRLMKQHEEIKNYQSLVEKARAQYARSKGLYFPTLDLSADGGWEKIDREYSSDTEENRYNASLRASQLVTDFGKTTRTIQRAQLQLKQAESTLESNRQRLMLEGITAYVNIIRARERLKSARLSESRIKELTGIEKNLVEKKAGLSSDVLQAKSQLSGAMASRVEASGELYLAKNKFKKVFYRTLTQTEIDSLIPVQFPSDQLPVGLDEAISKALEKNQELLITLYDSRIAQKEIGIARTAYYPRLNLFAEAATKDNDDGIIGYRNEFSAGGEFKFNIFNGGTDSAALKAALAQGRAAAYHTDYVKKVITEQVSNSWDQLNVLNQRAELLRQQADIVLEFLVLAKKERTMGTRSLLDVLNGEVNYINAASASIAAREDTKIAAFNLIYSMGGVHLDLFR